MADPYPIRPFGPEEFDATHLVDMHAFHGRPMPEKQRAERIEQFEFDRSLAAYDGGTPVGCTGIYSLRMYVPGATVPVAGVTYVAVLPTHRRRGILSSLMHRQLSDLRDRGEAVAALWASETPIYGRYGYGAASWQVSCTFERGDGALGRQAPEPGPGLRLRLAGPETVRAEVGKLYDTVLPTRPGMYARDEHWWNRRLATMDNGLTGDGDPVHCLLAEDDSGPRGYAVYAATSRWNEGTFLPDGRVSISEVVAIDPAATAAIWRDLLSRDLTGEFETLLRPVDDPLLYLLSDMRRARRRLVDALWVRLVDVPRALAQRRYASQVDVVIEVTDRLLPQNQGRWRLRTEPGPGAGGQAGRGPGGQARRGPDGGSPGGGLPGFAAGPAAGLAAECTAASGPADLSVDVSGLGAAYLGGTRLGGLAEAGLITEHRAGALAALSAAMSWDPAPWCPMIF